MSTLGSMLEALTHPAQRHAMLVHLPVAVSMLSLPAVIALAWTRAQSKTLRWCCIALLGVGTVGGWMAEEAGEEAFNELDTVSLSEPAHETLEEHEEMGENVWRLFGVTTVACALTMLRPPRGRIAALVVTVVLTIVLTGYVAVTAHHGGTLVYQHGVVVPVQSHPVP